MATAAQADSYTLQASWEGINTGTFTIGFSVVGGPDVVGPTFSSRFTGELDDLTPYVKSVTYSRGRTSGTGAITAGGGSVVLADEDGTFNPSNPDSPLAGLLKPMRPIRMLATKSGIDYPVFYMFARSIEHNPDPNVLETTIEMIDLFEWLTRFSPVLESAGRETVGEAIGRVLNAIYWFDPTARSLDGGDDITGFTADGSSTGLSLVQDTLLAIDPGGLFFVNAAGQPTYKDRHTLQAQDAATTVTAAGISAAAPGTTSDNIFNTFTVTNGAGTPQTATDDASIQEYAPREGPSVSTDLLPSDEIALGLAGELARLYATPTDPVRDMALINGDSMRLGQILTLELGDRVTLVEGGGGTSGDFVIQQLQGQVSQGMKVHSVSYSLTAWDARDPIIVGVSKIGDGSIVTY